MNNIKNRKLKIGDRVQLTNPSYFNGECGIYRGISNDGWYIVELDNKHERCHSCDGRTKSGHGWWAASVEKLPMYKPGSLDAILFEEDYEKK